MEHNKEDVNDMFSRLTGEREDFVLYVETMQLSSCHVNLPNWVKEEGINRIERVNNVAVFITNEENRYTADLTEITGDHPMEPSNVELLDMNGDTVYELY